jgi:hypothetical protein
MKSAKELLGCGIFLAWEEACGHDFSLKSCRDVRLQDNNFKTDL